MFGHHQNQPQCGFYKENYDNDDQDNYQDNYQNSQIHEGDGDGDGSRTNLIVNYLPQNMTDKELYTLFIAHGPVDNVRIMKDYKTGYSYGFGFVKYVKGDDAARAINALNGIEYLNKRLKVSYARPPGQDIKNSNLYVTNLPKTINEDVIENMFGEFGQIVQKNILKDKITGMPRGVAFVRFSKREEAEAAMQKLNGKFLDGCMEPISIKVAEEHGKQKATYYDGWKAGYQMNKDGDQKRFSPGFRHMPMRGPGGPGPMLRRGFPPHGRGGFHGPPGRGYRFNPLSMGGGDMGLHNYF